MTQHGISIQFIHHPYYTHGLHLSSSLHLLTDKWSLFWSALISRIRPSIQYRNAAKCIAFCPGWNRLELLPRVWILQRLRTNIAFFFVDQEKKST